MDESEDTLTPLRGFTFDLIFFFFFFESVVAVFGSELASRFEEFMIESQILREESEFLESERSQILGSGGGSQFLGSQFNVTGPSYTSCTQCVCEMTDEIIAGQKRCERQGDAMLLARPLTYGYNSKSAMTQKYTCIWSRGAHSFTEALSGFMWVAVHGMNSICVVTRIKDLERELNLRMAMFGEEPEIPLRIFRNGLIGKVEDFVDPSSLPRRPLHQIIKKPFGVVSVVQDTKIVRTVSGGPKALSAKYDEENAINFLQNEMESGAVFTYNKTVQTAICALDHLFRHEFKANEIQVFVWKKKDGGQAKALPHIREDLDIEEHLTVMNNNPDSCVREEDLEMEEVLEIEEEQLAAMNKPDISLRDLVIKGHLDFINKLHSCVCHLES